ncbi:MAG: hypothetical protein M3R27_09285 [Bacteroidota bacterium]|nr:hypothetical protein [Bacteroidota bacterium]
MKQNIPFDHHGISGGISVRLKNGKTLDDICIDNIPEYDRDRFEAVAIRVYAGKEIIVTIYAMDKVRQEGNNFLPDKYPVKKFKLENLPFEKLYTYLEDFNFTLSSGNYALEEMQVLNK